MNLWKILLILAVIVIFVLVSSYFLRKRSPNKSVAIVVLGDLGHSPRMQYHSLSFADISRFEVELIGLSGSSCRPEVVNNSRIHIHVIKSFMKKPSWMPFFLYAILKVIYQSLMIFFNLCKIPCPNYILLQNPPSMPTLAVSLVVSFLRNSILAIDWHNLGFSILALKLRDKHWMVRLHRLYEKYIGRLSSVNLCVSNGMREYLREEFSIDASVMYDRSPDFFKGSRNVPVKNFHDVFARYSTAFEGFSFSSSSSSSSSSEELLWPANAPIAPFRVSLSSSSSSSCSSSSTPFTDCAEGEKTEKEKRKEKEKKNGEGDGEEGEGEGMSEGEGEDGGSAGGGSTATWRANRPALLVSPTSWTPDEDFTILLDAVEAVETRLCADPALSARFPRVVMVITGKGPMLEEMMKRIWDHRPSSSSSSWTSSSPVPVPFTHFSFHPLWLESKDYPTFLAAADLGISMHQSSSGIDLPMKVVDLFGCEVPVLARNFRTIHELVQDGENGLLFDTSAQLADQLVTVLTDFPRNDTLHALKGNVQTKIKKWSEEWGVCVFDKFP